MKRNNLISGNIIKVACLLTAFALVISCTDSKIDVVRDSNIKDLPSLTEKNIETIFSDSGKLQFIMSSPLIERYTNIESPYAEFLNGVNVIFYDGKTEPVATLSANYAKFYEEKNLWELRDSVVVISDKKLETELLYFDNTKDLVYTERFVKITDDDETIMGTGFESNSRFDSYSLKHTSATIYR